MKKSKLLLSAGLAVVLLFVTFSTVYGSSDVVRWRMPVLWAKGTDYYKVGGPEFAALVKKMSDGKFIITPFGPGEISGALDYGDGLSKGTFEMALWHDGYWAGRDMGVGYFGYMPFAQMDFSDFNYWFWEGGGVELAREYYDPLNIYYLSTSGYSDLEPVFSKKPIRSVEDFKGIKMRSSGIALSFFKNMGASPVALGGDATYEALSRGVIDAVEHTPAAMMMDMGVHEVTEYVIEPMYHQPYTNTAYYVYAPAWKKLPENFKAILTAASFQICEIFRTKSLKAEFEVKQKLKEKGMKFIWLPKEETDKMTKIAESLWKEHAKASPYAHKVIKSQTDFLKKLGRLPEDWKLD